MKRKISILLVGLLILTGLQAWDVGAYAVVSERNLVQDEGKGYSTKTMGALMTACTTAPNGIGVEGRLGVSYGRDGSIDGRDFSDSSWFSRDRSFDYNATVAFVWKPSVSDVSFMLDAHVSWDTVTFQNGTVKDWSRTTFHTLSAGFAVGFSMKIADSSLRGTKMTIYLSDDWGLWSARTTRSRTDGRTSGASGGPIDAFCNDIRMGFGITVSV